MQICELYTFVDETFCNFQWSWLVRSVRVKESVDRLQTAMLQQQFGQVFHWVTIFHSVPINHVVIVVPTVTVRLVDDVWRRQKLQMLLLLLLLL